jgi:hypothetical protein
MQCPGQDTRYWKPGDIFDAPCPKCGKPVEFFKDESTRRCRNCGQPVTNPRMDFGCAAYCKYAEQCLGELSPDLLSKRRDLLKDRVAVEMKKFFKRDFKSIDHAMKVARYAEQIASLEKADLAVLLAASYLHGIACPEPADEGPSAGAVCEGLGSVQTILKGLGAEEEMVEHVLHAIVALRGPGEAEAEEKTVQILRDAHTISEWQERFEHGGPDGDQTTSSLDTRFRTEGGRSIAENILLKE